MELWKSLAWMTFALSWVAMFIILYLGLTCDQWLGKIGVSIGFAIFVLGWIIFWWRGGIRKEKEEK